MMESRFCDKLLDEILGALSRSDERQRRKMLQYEKNKTCISIARSGMLFVHSVILGLGPRLAGCRGVERPRHNLITLCPRAFCPSPLVASLNGIARGFFVDGVERP